MYFIRKPSILRMTKNEGKHYPHASGLFNADYCKIRGTMENGNGRRAKAWSGEWL